MAASEETDVVDSWEDIEESGVLDRKFPRPSSPAPEESENVSPMMSNGPIILPSGPYPMPEPTVKILKRPQRNSTGNGHVLNGDTKPRQPVKTLQQREQAYAEARLRIMGEARSPEEQLFVPSTDDRINKIQTKMEVLKTSESGNVVRHPKGPDGTRGFNLRR